MAAVGLDIPTLNTIIFASPRSEVPSIWTNFEKINKELPPKGYDIIDNSIQVYSRQFNNRRRIIKEINMHIMCLKYMIMRIQLLKI